MKKRLSKLENHYYYGISRYFWHVIIGLAVLGVVAGLGLYLWSQIPVSIQKVEKINKPLKPEFPDQKKVSLESIFNAMPIKIERKVVKTEPNVMDEIPVDYQEVRETVDSLALRRFIDELDVTKTLIPDRKENNGFWKGSGRHVYKNERDEKMYRKTHNPSLRHWEETSPGFKKHFIKYTNAQGVKKYNNKTDLLAAFNKLLYKTDSVNRKALITKSLIVNDIKKLGDTQKAINIYNDIGLISQKMNSNEQINAVKYLYKFASEKIDGIKLIRYETKIIDSVSGYKFDFIKTIHKEYKNHYNNNLISLTQATDQFIPYLAKIKPNLQDTALKYFYKLYRNNNKERSQNIKNIENDYAFALQNWENNYQKSLAAADRKYNSKKANKSRFESLSLESMMYGFVSVLIVSLILLILSMIRNVNKLSETMLENNKLFQNNITNTITKPEVTDDGKQS